MALTFKKIQTHQQEYPFVENLLHISFPKSERRDDKSQRYNTDHNPLFDCYLISDTGEGEHDVSKAIGFITVWTLGDFHFLEHFATLPEMRNKGYGGRVMLQIKDLFPGLLVLEVEQPLNEMSAHRIGFYQRYGFSLCKQDYAQPVCQEGEKVPSMYLMYAGKESIDTEFETIRDVIYREVYGIKQD